MLSLDIHGTLMLKPIMFIQNRRTETIMLKREALTTHINMMTMPIGTSILPISTSHIMMKTFIHYPGVNGETYHDGKPIVMATFSNDWVPSLNLQWKFSDARNLQLSYLTVISRPGIDYLNPAVVSTSETRQFGNSHLKSTHFNQAVLTYTTIKPKCFNQLVGAYAFSNKAYVNTQYVDDGIQVYTYDNSAKYRMSAIIDYFQ